MRISSNTMRDQGLSAILRNQAQLEKTQMQVSSGRRMLTPADDPSGAAQALELMQTAAMNQQYASNRNMASDSLSLVETSMGQISNLIQHARALVVSAGNGTLTDADRKTIATQLASSLDELTGAANARDGQGRYLFAGFQSQVQPFTTTTAGVQYNGDDGQRLIQVDSSRQLAISVSGADLFTRIPAGNGSFVTADVPGNTGNGVINPGSVLNPANLTGHSYSINFSISAGVTTYDVVDTTTSSTVQSAQPYTPGTVISFDGMSIAVEGTPAAGDQFLVAPAGNQSIFKTLQNLVTLLQTPSSGTGSAARIANGLKQGILNLDQGLNNVLTHRGAIGARLNEIDALQSVGDSRSLEYQKTLSRLQDLDLNVAISNLTQQQLFLQAAQKSFVQVSGLSMFNYI